jgi:hypothetical protein
LTLLGMIVRLAFINHPSVVMYELIIDNL